MPTNSQTCHCGLTFNDQTTMRPQLNVLQCAGFNIVILETGTTIQMPNQAIILKEETIK